MLVQVISVNGQSINTIDGKADMTVSRQQLDETIKTGKIQIDNLVVKCINKQRDNKNKIISYIVSDKNGSTMQVIPEQLKNAIYNYKVYGDYYSKSPTSIKLIPINK